MLQRDQAVIDSTGAQIMCTLSWEQSALFARVQASGSRAVGGRGRTWAGAAAPCFTDIATLLIILYLILLVLRRVCRVALGASVGLELRAVSSLAFSEAQGSQDGASVNEQQQQGEAATEVQE